MISTSTYGVAELSICTNAKMTNNCYAPKENLFDCIKAYSDSVVVVVVYTNKSSRRSHTSAKENMVWTLDTDYFQNLTVTSLSKDTLVINFHENPITLSGDVSQIV